MAKPILSENRKIYLKDGYLTHLTIKWKDVTKNEKAIVTVLGTLKTKKTIPFTLMFMGHNKEVLKEVTQTGVMEANGVSAICRFEIKSLLGSLKEEDVDKITVKIEMDNQLLEVASENNWLRIATTCLERFHEACKQNDAEKHPSEKDTYFKWVRNKYTPSKVQLAEAVQDQFNFGSGAYNCDPEAFEFEVNIDIGKQIHDSIKNPNGGMHPYYLRAKGIPGVPISFIWYSYKNGDIKRDVDNNPIPKNHSFGGDYLELLKTKAWPFGRVSAVIKDGHITVCDDGKYFVEGRLVFNDDMYSWKPDGSELQNVAIKVAGQNHNAPSLGNWGGAVTPSIEDIGNNPPTKNDVTWGKASSAYKDYDYEMPIKYTKDFYFYIHGKSL